jgi:hypothetical protein
MASDRECPGNLQRSCVISPRLFSLLIGLAVPSMAGAQNPQPGPPAGDAPFYGSAQRFGAAAGADCAA